MNDAQAAKRMIDVAENNGEATPAADVGAQQVGATYAKALLASAQKSGNLDQVAEDFRATIDEVLNKMPRLEHVLRSRLIAGEEKLPLIERVFRGRVSGTFLNFLKVVANKGRLDALRAMFQEFQKQHDALRGVVRVQLTTAAPVSSQVQQAVQQKLKHMLSGEPVVETNVDPKLIGGLVLRIGDTVYDGSIARQLQQVREQMINRSVHEIQSGRNRFRNSG
jgi:F-type H+-transporting ATPase subunit delta